MKNDRIIIALIIATFSMSGVLAWHLFAPAGTARTFTVPRANINDASAADQVADAKIPDKPERRIAAAPISKDKAVSAVAVDHGRVRYYDPATGKAWEVDVMGGKDQLISPTILPRFMESVWSPTKHEVISAFRSDTGTIYKYFDYVSKRAVTLGSFTTPPVFSPDGRYIAAVHAGADLTTIVVSDPDGQNQKTLLATRLAGVSITWPEQNHLAITAREVSTGTASVFTLTMDGKLEKWMENLAGLETLWAPGGIRVLGSYFNEEGGLVAAIWENGQPTATLNLAARASECAWTDGGDRLICAVSQTPISRATVETRSITTADFYEIVPADGTQKLLFSSGTGSAPASVGQLLLSLDGDYIIFINRYDGKLYSFKR